MKMFRNLTDKEVAQAILGVRNAFKSIKDIQGFMPKSCQLQLPKIPPTLSESIVAIEISMQRSPVFKFVQQVNGGGNVADLIVDGRRVEVKATGRNGFQLLSMKDVTCAVLVWADFGNICGTACGVIKLHWFTEPRSFPSGKVSMKTLLGSALAAGTVQTSEVTI